MPNHKEDPHQAIRVDSTCQALMADKIERSRLSNRGEAMIQTRESFQMGLKTTRVKLKIGSNTINFTSIRLKEQLKWWESSTKQRLWWGWMQTNNKTVPNLTCINLNQEKLMTECTNQTPISEAIHKSVAELPNQRKFLSPCFHSLISIWVLFPTKVEIQMTSITQIARRISPCQRCKWSTKTPIKVRIP